MGIAWVLHGYCMGFARVLHWVLHWVLHVAFGDNHWTERGGVFWSAALAKLMSLDIAAAMFRTDEATVPTLL